MKKYTILERGFENEKEVMLINNSDIYDVVWLQTCVDDCYILSEDGNLSSVEDYYPSNYFEGSKDRLVIPVSRIRQRMLSGETIEIEGKGYIDVTEDYMSYVTAKAVDIEHGINTDRIVFDADDDEYGWKSVGEADAEAYTEHEQDYPRQQLTRIYECSNGSKIRETSPFFPDDSIESYEYID